MLSRLQNLPTALAFSRSTSSRGIKRLTLEDQGITKIGDRIAGGFLVENIQFIQDFNVTFVQLAHEKTKAKFVHLDTEDTNNAFSVTFRTPAKESTGVAHILEHVVLCGSEKYPVRDPFFKMLKRSMNTFMNAMTAQDFTTYPFSTVVEQDFENLLKVYLDATFFPLIRKTDFLQEGHRLEVLTTDDSKKQLKRTGVVYNEMKGHLSDSSSLFMQQLQSDIFGENSVFGSNSGGNWKKIPDLTYERLVQFHKSHYHPSNCLFLTYGDLPITKTLEKVDQLVLNRFDFDSNYANQSILDILEKKLPTEKSERINTNMVVPADKKNDDKLKISRSWKINEFDHRSTFNCLVGGVLSSLLLSGSQAPIYSSLIDSQIAPSFAPYTGFECSNFTPTFSIGASGVTDLEKTEKAIEDGIQKALKEGFPEKRIDAIIHSLELSIRHKKANFGLNCLMALAPVWTHSGNLIEQLMVTDAISELKRKSTPEFWKKLVNDLVWKGWNNYDVKITSYPSDIVTLKDNEEELKQVASIKLTESEMKALEEENEKLKRERETVENVSVLPTLDVLKDVPLITPEAIQVAHKVGISSSREIQQVSLQQTNGVTYLRSFFESSSKSSGLNRLIPLLCDTLGDVDAGKRSYQDLDVDLELFGGQLSCGPSVPIWLGVDAAHQKQGKMTQGIFVSLDCLTKNRQVAYAELLGDILTSSNFHTDNGKRLQSLLGSAAQAMTGSISQDASRYAKLISRAPHGKVFTIEEINSGFSKFKLIQKANSVGFENMNSIATALQVLAEYSFTAENEIRGSFVDTTGESVDAIDEFFSRFSKKANCESLVQESVEKMRNLGLIGLDDSEDDPLKKSRATYLGLAVPVHYCSAIVKTEAIYGHVDDAALKVLAQIATYDYLHQHVREKGGAYGTGASFDLHGLFSLSSFWDPNSTNTLDTFSNCLKWLCDANFTEKQVDEALLSIFGALDAPLSPSSKGMTYFLHGITAEMRDAQREKYFDLVGKTGIEKLRTVAQKHLSGIDSFINLDENRKTSVCVAGKKETGLDVFSKFQNWKIEVA